MSLDKYVAFATKSFALPDVCLRIRGILDDPRSDAEAIGKVISLDPSLCAKVLRLANSSLFRFPSQVSTITKAVNVVGGEALYNLVMAETANSAFKYFNTKLIDLDKHWYKSVYCGMVGRYLGRQMGIRGSERFFVMGVLKNLSELVVANKSPDKYQKYLNDESELSLADKQLTHFGFTFAECSGAILEVWKLPLVLYYPVKYLHDPAKQASDTDVSLFNAASSLADLKMIQPDCESVELFLNSDINTLNLDKSALLKAVEHADKETAKVSMMM